MKDFLKHMKLIESVEVNEDQHEDEFNLDPEEVGVDEPEQLGSYDVDDELDMEIARSISDDFDMEQDALVDDEFDLEPETEVEPDSQDPVFNYTATIQIHGYDFPLVLQADDMDEIKTVMQVLKQSGLNPQGDYKWNSKTFEIDLDESVDGKKLDESSRPIDSFVFSIRARDEYKSSNERVANEVLQMVSGIAGSNDTNMVVNVDMKESNSGRYSIYFSAEEFDGSAMDAERELRQIVTRIQEAVEKLIKEKGYNFSVTSVSNIEN